MTDAPQKPPKSRHFAAMNIANLTGEVMAALDVIETQAARIAELEAEVASLKDAAKHQEPVS